MIRSNLRNLAAATILAVSALSAPVNAEPAYLRGYVKTLAEAVETCMTHIPDMRAARRAMDDGRLAEVDSKGSSHFFATAGGNVIAVVDTSATQGRCMVGVDGLYDDDAEEVLRRVTQEIGARFVGPIDPGHFKKVERAFLIGTSEKAFVVGVSKIVNLSPFYRGALLMIRSAN